MKRFNCILLFFAAFQAFFVAQAQQNKNLESGFVTFINEMPLPLGRYVQLANPKVSFSTSDYHSSEEPSVRVNLYFDFKIVKHLPNLEYMSFHAGSLEPYVCTIKFKKDQNAVESLSEAVANTAINEKTIMWSEIARKRYAGSPAEMAKKINGLKMRFEDSSVYVKIPQSKVKFKGFGSEYVTAKEPSSIKIYSQDGISRLHFTIDVPFISDKEIYPAHVTVRTIDGSFEATLKPDSLQGYNLLMFENYNLSPREMDKLLSIPLEISVFIKANNHN